MIIRNFPLVIRVPQTDHINTGIELVQNDQNVYTLEIRITNGITDIDYTQVDHATITFAKADGNVVQGDLVKAASGFTYELGTNEIACDGRVVASIQLFGNIDERLTTSRISFEVIKDLITPSAVQSTSEFPLLQQALQDVQQAVNNANQAATDANAVAQAYGDLDARVNEHDAQLAEKANYRQDNNDTCPNMIAGYNDNAVASNLYSCTIVGGGTVNRENVIGGNVANVGTANSNKPVDETTEANYSTIMGGYDNVANGLASTIVGFHNYINKPATHGTINGGSTHAIKDGDYNTISGGMQNTIENGDGNVINGGTNNLLPGNINLRTVSGGSLNQASGAYSTIPGGYENIADGTASLAQGMSARARTHGQNAHAYGKFVTQGDAQESRFVLKNQTTDATPVEVGLNGTTRPQMPNDASWYVKYTVVARRADVEGETKAWTIEGLIQNSTNQNASAVGTPTITVIASSANTDAWGVALGFGADSIGLRATGEAGKTINWVAKLETVEVIA